MKKNNLLSLVAVLLFITALTAKGQYYGYDLSWGGTGQVSMPEEWIKNKYRGAGLTSDNKLIIAGTENNAKAFLIKYTSYGVLDNSFGSNGYIKPLKIGSDTVDEILAFSMLDDELVMIVNLDDKKYLMRYSTSGIPDNTLGTNGTLELADIGTEIEIEKMEILESGKYLFVGNKSDSFLVGRLNHDGTLDETFNGTGFLSEFDEFLGILTNFVITSTGDYILAGSNTSYLPDVLLAKIDDTGNIVSEFGEGGLLVFEIPESDDQVEDMILQPDGKILLSCNSNDGSMPDTWSELVRLNDDGSIDEDFGTDGAYEFDPTWSSDNIMAIALQSDNKILIGGYQGNNQADQDNMLMRLTDDGSADNTFAEDGVFLSNFGLYNSVYKIFALNDNNVLIIYKHTSEVYSSVLKPGGAESPGENPDALTENNLGCTIVLSNGAIHIRTTNSISGTATLCDLSGKIQLAKNVYNTSTFEIDIANFNPGIYILNISSEDQIYSRKVLLN